MRRPFPDPVTTPDRSEFEYLLRQEAVDRSARHSHARLERQSEAWLAGEGLRGLKRDLYSEYEDAMYRADN